MDDDSKRYNFKGEEIVYVKATKVDRTEVAVLAKKTGYKVGELQTRIFAEGLRSPWVRSLANSE